MKQLNKLVITVSNFFIFFTFLIFACLAQNSNSGMPHFGPQQNNSAKVYRSDSFNRIYDNRNRLEQLRYDPDADIFKSVQWLIKY